MTRDTDKSLQAIGAVVVWLLHIAAIILAVGSVISVFTGGNIIEAVIVFIICAFYIRWYQKLEDKLDK